MCIASVAPASAISKVNVLRGIADATGNGRRLVIASGDWNITADDLEASGVLEGLGLEIVRPTNGEYTCTASKKGTLIDYVVITQGFRSFIGSCEVVREVPCATHLGVRTTLVPNPADIEVQTLRKPRSLENAIVTISARRAASHPAGRSLVGRWPIGK